MFLFFACIFPLDSQNNKHLQSVRNNEKLVTYNILAIYLLSARKLQSQLNLEPNHFLIRLLIQFPFP
jgi:hypothetical protein